MIVRKLPKSERRPDLDSCLLSKKLSCSLGLIFFLLLLCQSCRLPRIIVLHDPLTAEEHNDLGVACERKGDLSLAEKEYKSALKLRKNFFEAQNNLGNVYARTGRINEAKEAYETAIKLDPQRPDPYNNLADLYLESDRNPDEAARLAEEAVKVAKAGRYIYLTTLGTAYLKQGRIDRAEAALTEALKDTPAEDKLVLAELYRNLAKVCEIKGDQARSADYVGKMKSLQEVRTPLIKPTL